MEMIKGLPMPDGMAKSEIMELLLREEYGFLPHAPHSVYAERESCDHSFCAGKADLEKIRLVCDADFGSFAFPVFLICPTKKKEPVPCFVHINFTDLIPDQCLPAEEIVDNGYAVLYFCYASVTSDDGNFNDGLAGLVYPGGRTSETQCGKIGLWAWAVSRVMDYALTLPQLDPSRISVVGHSRLGKTALLAGALDERFCCAFSNDSGSSGAALSRDNRKEKVHEIYEKFPYWFCENYGKYANHEEMLPFDQHFLLAANAPHRVYVSSAAEDVWADSEKEYLSCVAADGYFRQQGLSGFIRPDRPPVPGDFFGNGHIGYHLRPGTHYLSREDWQYFIKYLERV